MKESKNKDKSSNKNDKGSLKNYIILIIIFLLGIGLTLYLCKWYSVYDSYKKQTPVIRGTLQEITSNDLEHYLLDNPTSVIYMCVAEDDNCRSFEKSLKKYVIQEDLTDSIIYLNLSYTDKDSFINDFNSKYPYKVKLSTYPAIVVYKDGKVDGLLQGKEDKKLTMTNVDNFLDYNMVEEDEQIGE